ncbi:MAG: FAD:protein FMN transferase [Oscillospiraceae bacterium]|nr:FAD:protein FMN transferase [Oscillospiraceae bacterium]
MRRLNILTAAVCVVILSSCAVNNELSGSERTVYAMDTVMTLKAFGGDDEVGAALDEAEKEIKYLDNILRRENPDSDIYKINRTGSAEVSEDTFKLIKTALDICESTDGAFDISTAPVSDLWGFYTKNFYVPSDIEIAEALSGVGYENIYADENRIYAGGVQLDLGGMAKGYLSEKIMEIFKNNDVRSGIVSLGGNVHTLGTKPDGGKWRIAVQDPDSDEYIGEISVNDKAVITSGGYMRFFEQDGIVYHHIIDPKTGYPAKSGIKSVSIVSDSGTLADGLSTALFVMGLDKSEEYWRTHSGFDAVFMTDDDNIYITEGIEDCFESRYDYTVIRR